MAYQSRKVRCAFSRAQAYIGKMPAAVSGQNGHGATFKVALVLLWGFELDLPSALELMREYNAQCSPPWTEKELKHKLVSARANRSKYKGKRLI